MIKLAIGHLLVLVIIMMKGRSSSAQEPTELPSTTTDSLPSAGGRASNQNNTFKGARKFPLCITGKSLLISVLLPSKKFGGTGRM